MKQPVTPWQPAPLELQLDSEPRFAAYAGSMKQGIAPSGIYTPIVWRGLMGLRLRKCIHVMTPVSHQAQQRQRKTSTSNPQAEATPTSNLIQARRWPPRPGPQLLSIAIPLFFIARDPDGFWVARESDGRIGGIFVLRRSALQFAKEQAGCHGCATMFLPDRFQLDIKNSGNPVIGRLQSMKKAIKELFAGG